MRSVLEQLEGLDRGPSLWAPLAYLAGLEIEYDADERYATFRRAELLLATGGDPRRPVELSDRAVETVADDLATPQRHAQLAARLAELEPETEDFPAVREALRLLGSDPDLSWRVYAWALLAEHMDADES
ncbi:MAG: hypothetical protein H0X21_07915 [Actinobacteria bacterium]|nr:hypothetical protein [Actinomycetota bacterium]